MTRPRTSHEAWTAADAERWLLSLELFGMRFGLDRMRRLQTALGTINRFRAVHVVGTNGKSSTVRMTAAILEHHGVRTGAFLSPHLVSFTERIRIGSADIEPAAFARAMAAVHHAAELVERTLEPDDRVTQFEALTAGALDELARAAVQAGVIEAGLGGRWDATNVLDAEIVVLTNVGLEHTRWLGPTVRDIAREKLAVLSDGATLVLGADLHPDAEAEAQLAAARRDARIVRAGAEPDPADLPLLARGSFQRRNFALASAAAQAYLGELDPVALRAAAGATAVPGRFEIVDDAPVTVYDGAHNPGGVAALVDTLEEFLAGRPLVAVLSVLDDKDAAAMLAGLLPLCAALVLTSNANPRALSPATLQSLAGQVGAPPAMHVEADPRAAVRLARTLAGPGAVVLATGSIYLIADLLRPAGAGRGSVL